MTVLGKEAKTTLNTEKMELKSSLRFGLGWERNPEAPIFKARM